MPDEDDVPLLEVARDAIEDPRGSGGDTSTVSPGVSPGTTPSSKTVHGRPSDCEISSVVRPSYAP